MVWAYEQRGLSPAAKLVLLKLADHANDDGECWPAQAAIARDTGLKRETVNRQVRALAAAGLVEVIAQHSAHGQIASLYRLLFDPCDDRSHPGVTTDHNPCDDRSHQDKPPLNHQADANASAAPAREADPPVEQSKGKRLPAHWQPDGAAIAFASDLGLDAYAIADEFRDYWLSVAGAKGSKRDWAATWRNWCRREAKPLNAAKQSPGMKLYEGAARAVEAFNRRHGLDRPDNQPVAVPLLDGGRPSGDAPGPD